jgi:inward rectifier potassium channel
MPDENDGVRAVAAAADTPLAPPSARTAPSSSPPPPQLPVEEEVKDLGFGSVVARESRRRLLNRDGTFNVRRRGIGVLGSISPYHSLLTLSWPKFLGLAALVYALLNALFAAAYVLCGTDALQGPAGGPAMGAATRAFYFSVETFGTIGYGNIVPVTNAANAIVTIESFAGLITIALATGLVFARFSRPTALIAYSRVALVAPYRGITAFEFRVANRRNTQIIDLGVKVLFTRLEGLDGSKVRRFHELPLERTKVAFFPLAWTVVHPIDAHSPLRGLTHADLIATDAEFLVLFTGMDETFSQTVHSRSSYKPDEIVWGAKFADVFNRSRDQEGLSVDIGRLDLYERVSVVPDA